MPTRAEQGAPTCSLWAQAAWDEVLFGGCIHSLSQHPLTGYQTQQEFSAKRPSHDNSANARSQSLAAILGNHAFQLSYPGEDTPWVVGWTHVWTLSLHKRTPSGGLRLGWAGQESRPRGELDTRSCQ